MTIHDFAIALDRFDHDRRRAPLFVGDRRIGGGKIDRPHRLRAEHERIMLQAFAIHLRLDREPG